MIDYCQRKYKLMSWVLFWSLCIPRLYPLLILITLLFFSLFPLDYPPRTLIIKAVVGLLIIVVFLALLWRTSHKGLTPYKGIHKQKMQLESIINCWTSPISQMVRKHLRQLPKNHQKVLKCERENESSSSTPSTIVYTKTLFSSSVPSLQPNVALRWSSICWILQDWECWEESSGWTGTESK